MAYRRHRFSFSHALREVGTANAGAFDLADAAASGGTFAFLLDDQAERLYATPGLAGYRLYAHRGYVTAPTRPKLTRCIIPAGHSFGQRECWVRAEAGAPGAWAAVAGNDHEGIYHHAYDGGLLEIGMGAGSDEEYLALRTGTATTSAPQLGELVFSDTFQPATGEVYDWAPLEEATSVETLTRSGRLYVADNGPPRRVQRVVHQAVSGADLEGYRRLRAAVGNSRPFWYEDSDSGDYRVLLDPCDSTANRTPVGCTIALGTGSDGNANNAIAATPGAGGVTVVNNFASPVDMRGKRLSLDIRADGADADTAAHIIVRLQDATGNRVQFHNLGGPVASSTGQNWCRHTFDPSRIDGSFGTVPLDLGNVSAWQILAGKPATNEVRYDSLYLYDVAKAPRLCRFRSFEPRQDNPAPRSPLGPTYTITMEIEEVLG